MSTNFDFDYLSKLYQTDPEKFEEFRKQEIDKIIESAPDKSKKRLQGLQFQIDAKREIHKNSSLGACIAISKMMHESFENLRYHLNQAVNKKDPLGNQSTQFISESHTDNAPAKVIQLRG